LNERVGAVDLGLKMPAIVTANESCLQSTPFGALDRANASLTTTIVFELLVVLKLVNEASRT
jgi:hypothetical protein